MTESTVCLPMKTARDIENAAAFVAELARGAIRFTAVIDCGDLVITFKRSV